MSATSNPGKKSHRIDELKLTTSNFITRSSSFKKLCSYVFSICDTNNTGSINSTELYAGVLLVHLNLAKYAGPAACFPASRSVVDQLFSASDDDNSGIIDEKEFEAIMVSDDDMSSYHSKTSLTSLCFQQQVISAASISSRILAYYAILLVLVPYLAAKAIALGDTLKLDDGIAKLGETWVAWVPGRLLWIVKLIPYSFWLALPEKIINLAFVRIVLHDSALCSLCTFLLT